MFGTVKTSAVTDGGKVTIDVNIVISKRAQKSLILTLQQEKLKLDLNLASLVASPPKPPLDRVLELGSDIRSAPTFNSEKCN